MWYSFTSLHTPLAGVPWSEAASFAPVVTRAIEGAYDERRARQHDGRVLVR
jgi:hypothetical protein